MSIPCAALVLKIEPSTASPGAKVKLLATLTNCSDESEELTVGVVVEGPGHHVTDFSAVVTLGAGETRVEKLPFSAPDAPGLYSVTAVVTSGGAVLTEAHATLTVN